jgi:hypothetical protein
MNLGWSDIFENRGILRQGVCLGPASWDDPGMTLGWSGILGNPGILGQVEKAVTSWDDLWKEALKYKGCVTS